MVEILNGNANRLAEESADLLYHLIVAWAYYEVEPSKIYALLAQREGLGGLAEKESRNDPNQKNKDYKQLQTKTMKKPPFREVKKEMKDKSKQKKNFFSEKKLPNSTNTKNSWPSLQIY